MNHLFKDRTEAGLRLGQRLKESKYTNGLVLAIPRGGIPVGCGIARELGIPLDIILSKKITHPFHSEYAIGAVSLDDYILEKPKDVSTEYINSEIQQIRTLLEDRYQELTGNDQPLPVKDKTIILTDDGIATGKTILLAVRMVRKRGASNIVVAAPVVAPEAMELLQREVEVIITLLVPDDFMGVGQFYKDFHQLTDEEVIPLLKKNRMGEQKE
jgi:putative phosphoribosyl transferase